MNDGDMQGLLDCMNPFVAGSGEAASFNFRKPTLSAISCDQRDKLDYYNKMVFEKLVLDMMKAGSEKAEQLLDFAKMAAKKLDEVDLVEHTLRQGYSLPHRIASDLLDAHDLWWSATNGCNTT